MKTLTDATRKLLPSLNGGARFDPLSDDAVIHIPAFKKANKATITSIEVPAHEVVFKLPAYDEDTVRYFSLALNGLMKQPNYESLSKEHNDFCKLTELVNSVIPTLKGELGMELVATTKVDYTQALKTLGLDFVSTIKDVEYDNYTTGLGKTKHGLSVIIPKANRSLIEDSLKATKVKNVFKYSNELFNFDVVRDVVTDEDGIEVVSLKYRFTVTKA